MPVNNTPTFDLPYKWGFFVAPFGDEAEQAPLVPLEDVAQATYVNAKAAGDAFERVLALNPYGLKAARRYANKTANRAHNNHFRWGFLLGTTNPLAVSATYGWAAAKGWADGLAPDDQPIDPPPMDVD